VKRQLTIQRNQEWDKKLREIDAPNHTFWKLAPYMARKNEDTRSRPLHGPQGLKFTPEGKTEIFATKLGDTFQPNHDLYEEQTIQAVRRQVRKAIAQAPQQEPKLTTPKEVAAILRHLPIQKAPGPDRIPNQALKEAPRRLSVFLSLLFNTIFLTQKFPSSWKKASICMIPKPGKNPVFPQNYRPISLLSTISKVFEKILLTRLRSHAESHNLLPPHQLGFRQQFDTELQLVRVVDKLTLSSNNFAYTIRIFLDVEKAFDRVWHRGLISKLIQQRFPDCYVKLIHSYLNNRELQVRYEGAFSESKPIRAGVPQGSVLSPLLYALYTADLPTTPGCSLATFADDTAIFATNRNFHFVHRAATRQLEKIEEWATKWRGCILV